MSAQESRQVIPTRGGQAVRNVFTGAVGITTDEPRKRSASIGVQLIGRNYPVLIPVDELTVVELQELTTPERSAEDIAAEVVGDFPGLKESFKRIFQGWVAEASASHEAR